MKHAVICNKDKYADLKGALEGSGTEVHAGIGAACDLVTLPEVDSRSPFKST